MTSSLADSHWSAETLPLSKAVLKAPVLVKLEDGFRGCLESLSFSLGDVMALEGCIEARGKRLVLAHYTSEMEDENGASGDTYCSLLTIPWEHLPQVDVRVCQDPRGLAYSNFVTSHFPQLNWQGQKQELLDELDDDDYDQIQEITPKPRRPSTSGRKPPAPPPSHLKPRSPRTPDSGSSTLPTPVSGRSTLPTHASGRSTLPTPCRPPRRYLSLDQGVSEHQAANKQALPLPPRPRRQGVPNGKEALFPSERTEDPTNDARRESQASDDGSYLELVDGVSDDEYVLMETLRKASPRSPRLGNKTYSTQKEETKAQVKTAAVKPTMRVHPGAAKLASALIRPTPAGDISDDDDYDKPTDYGLMLPQMTCRQLCARLMLCGMPTLAKTCDANKLDGAFLCNLSDDDLRRAPFSLNDFEIKLKLKEVKIGWVPK